MMSCITSMFICRSDHSAANYSSTNSSTNCKLSFLDLNLTYVKFRLANRLFHNNWQFLFSILVQKPLFTLFCNWFFQKNLKFIAFLIVCDKGVYSGKPDCLVLTKISSTSFNLTRLLLDLNLFCFNLKLSSPFRREHNCQWHSHQLKTLFTQLN